jgi:hypothetical protein
MNALVVAIALIQARSISQVFVGLMKAIKYVWAGMIIIVLELRL